MSSKERYQQTKRLTIISATINSLLAIFKVIVGVVGHSQALVADGLHSFSDLITDVLVFWATKTGVRQPDSGHPYGHQRIETITAIIIALIIMFVGIAIIYDTGITILQGKQLPMPDYLVLVIAVISIAANEWLYRYTLKIGKQVKSNLLIANAWHNRSDALTSIIVVVSVVGTLLGLSYLDAIGALIIAILIIKTGAKMAWNGAKELIDSGVDPETLSKITETIQNVPGVVSIHLLRTRLHGGNIFIDLHIIVNPFISVSEGHYIGDQVQLNLLRKIDNISDVTIHIDPEDDERYRPSSHLPNRNEILKHLQKRWQQLPGYAQIKKTTLHYLDGKLYVEIFMPLKIASNVKAQNEIVDQYRLSSKDIEDLASVVVHFMPEQ